MVFLELDYSEVCGGVRIVAWFTIRRIRSYLGDGGCMVGLWFGWIYG